jgi:hypothetical protein
MMAGLRALCALGSFAAQCQALADLALDGVPDRIAAHFEVLSSRLRAEDAAPLAQFVAKAENIPGAKLAVLMPATNDPSRARFVAARVAELEHRVRTLAETAEYRKVPGSVGADIVWLEIILPAPAALAEKTPPVALQPLPSVKTEPLSRPTPQLPATPLSAADLRLTDWVVRGVKHPAQGATYAYVARTGSSEAPREVVEQQIDKEFGLVKDISQVPEGSWVVHTEIGWIGQAGLAGSLEAGGH